MTHPAESIPRRAVDALLALPRHIEAVGAAVWLYLTLLAIATAEGIVVRSREALGETLAISAAELGDWLARLTDAKLVTVQTSSPLLVVKIESWSSHAGSVGANSVDNSVARAAPLDQGPVYGDSSADAIAQGDKSPGDRGQGEGVLRSAIGSVLTEADSEEIDRILDHYPAAVLRRALHRVERAGRIRKSKAALFRYLLGQFSHTTDVNDL